MYFNKQSKLSKYSEFKELKKKLVQYLFKKTKTTSEFI